MEQVQTARVGGVWFVLLGIGDEGIETSDPATPYSFFCYYSFFRVREDILKILQLEGAQVSHGVLLHA